MTYIATITSRGSPVVKMEIEAGSVAAAREKAAQCVLYKAEYHKIRIRQKEPRP